MQKFVNNFTGTLLEASLLYGLLTSFLGLSFSVLEPEK